MEQQFFRTTFFCQGGQKFWGHIFFWTKFFRPKFFRNQNFSCCIKIVICILYNYCDRHRMLYEYCDLYVVGRLWPDCCMNILTCMLYEDSICCTKIVRIVTCLLHEDCDLFVIWRVWLVCCMNILTCMLYEDCDLYIVRTVSAGNVVITPLIGQGIAVYNTHHHYSTHSDKSRRFSQMLDPPLCSTRHDWMSTLKTFVHGTVIPGDLSLRDVSP